jgi:hypothetical protein
MTLTAAAASGAMALSGSAIDRENIRSDDMVTARFSSGAGNHEPTDGVPQLYLRHT